MGNKIPNHLAIILDGNGRWAQAQNKPRTFGHEKGMNIIQDIAIEAKKIGINFLTVFCFSTENWNRPKDEVDYLMGVPERILSSKNIKKYNNENIKVSWVGRKTKLPIKTVKAIENGVEKTKQNDGLNLIIALDYGSFEELENSLKNIAININNGKIKLSDISWNLIRENLYTKDFPNIDLLIRTGGEKRLSNFMLLQSAYAELYFTDIFWPDFNKFELEKALIDFTKRDRRYGGIKKNG